jgi:hypothetical protein
MPHRGNGAGNAVTDTTKEVIAAIGTAAKETVSMLRNAATELEEKTDSAISAVGGGMKSLGSTLESSGRYLQRKNIGEIGTDLITRHPIPVLLVAAGLGFCVARAIRR